MKSNTRTIFHALMLVMVCFLGEQQCVKAQSSIQQSWTKTFFRDGNNNLLPKFAHPSCSVANIDVICQDVNTWLVQITYLDGKAYFACQYEVEMKNGLIVDLTPIKCGSKDLSCFDFCDMVKVAISELSSKDKDRFQRLFGKALDQLTCQQICLASLFYRWVDEGYYERFINSY